MNAMLIPGLREHLVAEADRRALLRHAADQGAARASLHAARRVRRPRRVAVLAGLATAAAVAGLLVTVDLTPRPQYSQAWAASAVRLAESVPRVLPADTRWKVETADQQDDRNGELTVRQGNRSVQLTWSDDAEYDSFIDDRSADGLDHLDDARALDTDVEIFRYGPTDDYEALLRYDGHLLRLRTGVDVPPEWQNKMMPETGGPTFKTHFTEAAFRSLLGDLTELSVDAWLQRMPASVVVPAENRKAVEELLEGVPLPAGFDGAALVDSNAPRDPYHLGAKVLGAVSCAWFAQWNAALGTGDREAARQAQRAMRSARSWPGLKRMADEGGYSDVLWSLAAQMKDGQAVNGYVDALGCVPGD